MSSTRCRSTEQRNGHPVIPVDAHVRLASAKENDGARILRRGYSFTDGVDESLGELEAGLFFISFQRHPEQFVAIQRRLGSLDALNEYIKHVGSAVFAVPPGASPGGYVGEALLGCDRHQSREQRRNAPDEPNPRPKRLICAGCRAALLAVFATACGSSDDETASAAAEATTLAFTLTDAGCDPDRRRGGGRPDHLRGRERRLQPRRCTELEVLDGETMLGETPRTSPRASAAASRLTLEQGEYTLLLPGRRRRARDADRDRRARRPRAAPRSKPRSPSYRAYLEENTDELVAATEPFVAAVVAGDVAEAKALYAGGPHPLRADRAGGRVLRQPRPADRRARERRCRRVNSAASTGSRRRSGKKGRRRAWPRSPSSCRPTSKNWRRR